MEMHVSSIADGGISLVHFSFTLSLCGFVWPHEESSADHQEE
jgi:hypothetical protein